MGGDRQLAIRRPAGDGDAGQLDERGGGVARQEVRVPQGGDKEITVGDDPPDPAALQCQREPQGGLRPGGRVRDDLGQHRIELDPDQAALFHARIPPGLRIGGRAPFEQGSRGGQKAGRRILGAEAGLDGMTGDGQIGLGYRQR